VNRAWKENRRSSGEGYLLSRGQAVRQNTHEGRTKRSRGTPKKEEAAKEYCVLEESEIHILLLLLVRASAVASETKRDTQRQA